MLRVQGGTLQQAVNAVCCQFEHHPAVIYSSAVTTSLGRQLTIPCPRRSPRHSHSHQHSEGETLQSGEADSAVIICNTESRDGWEEEFDDIRYSLIVQLRVQVRLHFVQ